MKILAIETTGKYASAAVACDGNITVSESCEAMNHLKDILVLCDESLKKAGVTVQDMDYVAADIGPGSFTGIRIGVTTARTLAQMTGAGCIGVLSLECLALAAREEAVKKDCRYVCPIINARRKQTYGAVYEITDDKQNLGLKAVLEPKQYMIDEIMDAVNNLGGRTMMQGDGIDAYEELIGELAADKSIIELADAPARVQNARELAELASVRTDRACEYEELLPEYMRLSEAEMRLKEGTLSSKIRR